MDNNRIFGSGHCLNFDESNYVKFIMSNDGYTYFKTVQALPDRFMQTLITRDGWQTHCDPFPERIREPYCYRLNQAELIERLDNIFDDGFCYPHETLKAISALNPELGEQAKRSFDEAIRLVEADTRQRWEMAQAQVPRPTSG